jgi:hypothetical protein
MSDDLESGKEKVVVELIKAGMKNPDVKSSGLEIAKTARTLTKAFNVVLFPLAAVNYAYDKAKVYFQNEFQNDLSKKTAAIPEEDLVEPKASIAGPALQGLAFSHDEQDLKEMYLNLIASSMDGRVADRAHPAFVEIIRQINSREAKIVGVLLTILGGLPIVELRLTELNGQAYRILLKHLVDMRNIDTKEVAEEPKLAAMIDNFIRLGLAEVSYVGYKSSPGAYDWVQSRPEYIRLKKERETEKGKVTITKGVLTPTAFGQQFALAVGIIPPSLASPKEKEQV